MWVRGGRKGSQTRPESDVREGETESLASSCAVSGCRRGSRRGPPSLTVRTILTGLLETTGRGPKDLKSPPRVRETNLWPVWSYLFNLSTWLFTSNYSLDGRVPPIDPEDRPIGSEVTRKDFFPFWNNITVIFSVPEVKPSPISSRISIPYLVESSKLICNEWLIVVLVFRTRPSSVVPTDSSSSSKTTLYRFGFPYI